MAMSLGKAQINVTPLIDVLLVLIIIFMVVLPERSTGLPTLLLPQPATAAAPAIPDDRDIVISVNKDLSISINEQPIALADLPGRLSAIFAARATNVIFVRGHHDLDFAAVARVIDAANAAGVIQVGLMTQW